MSTRPEHIKLIVERVLRTLLKNKRFGGCPPRGLAVGAHTTRRAAKMLGMGEQDDRHSDQYFISKP